MIAWTPKTIKHLPLDLVELQRYQVEVERAAHAMGTDERIVKLTITQEEYQAMHLSQDFPSYRDAKTLLGIPFEVEAAR